MAADNGTLELATWEKAARKLQRDNNPTAEEKDWLITYEQLRRSRRNFERNDLITKLRNNPATFWVVWTELGEIFDLAQQRVTNVPTQQPNVPVDAKQNIPASNNRNPRLQNTQQIVAGAPVQQPNIQHQNIPADIKQYIREEIQRHTRTVIQPVQTVIQLNPHKAESKKIHAMTPREAVQTLSGHDKSTMEGHLVGDPNMNIEKFWYHLCQYRQNKPYWQARAASASPSRSGYDRRD